MKKIIALLLALVMVMSLSACNLEEVVSQIEDLAEEVSEAMPEEDIVEETIAVEETEPWQDNEETEASVDPAAYDASAWIKDNVSISFYYMYQEGSSENEKLTLKVLGDKAVMFSKKGEEEERPTTIYEATDEGLLQTSLLYFGDSKGGYQGLPIEGKNLQTSLPYVLLIAGTFGCRVDSNPLKNMDNSGTETYIGRECDVYVKDSGLSRQEILVDKETGIILKNESVTILDGKETKYTSIYVTEFVYGEVTPEDVEVNLDEYDISYEEAQGE